MVRSYIRTLADIETAANNLLKYAAPGRPAAFGEGVRALADALGIYENELVKADERDLDALLADVDFKGEHR